MKIFYFILLFSINESFAQTTTGIYINEIMASNDATITDNTGEFSDWIELYNSNPFSVDLANYYLSDSPTNLTKFRFTSVTGQVVIPANGRLIIWASGFSGKGILHTNFSLSDSGEAIVLTTPNGTTIIDGFSFGKQRTDVSYGRLPNGGVDFKYFSPASPNASNSSNNAYNEILTSPTFSHLGGFYSSPFSLTISHSDPNVIIYYSNDGSIPSDENLAPKVNIYKNAYPLSQNDPIGPLLYDRTYQSNLYNNPLAINDRSSQPNFVSQVVSTYDTAPAYLPSTPVDKGTIIRAIAYKAGALPSDITSHTFFFSPTGANKYTFPVISLGIQENHLFNYYSGIYVAGVTFDNMIQQGYFNQCVGNYSNLGQSRPGSFEMIVDNASVLSQPIDVKIHGGCTKAFRLKSLNLYGKDDFEYDVFPNKVGVYHRNLILRNSGQDGMLFRDALYQNMVRHFRIDVQDYNPAVIFINGEYWGIENIREKHDKHYISKTYATSADSLDIIEVPGFLDSEEGDLVHFNNMVTYIQNNNLSNTINFEYAKTLLDVDNFIDYMIAEIYSTNTDWPQNNVRLWRKRTTQYLPNAPYGQDGRWRWMLLDMDFTLGFGQSSDFNGIEYATQSGNEFKDILRKLLENTSFRNAFINRFADFLNTAFLPSRTTAMLDAAKSKYAPEVNQHIMRWKGIKDYATWESTVASTREFLQERPAYQRFHIRSRWSISGEYNLTVDVSNAAHGCVRVNSIEIIPTTPGVSSNSYPWTGSYFNNIPIQIRPIAKTGYKFKHWVYNSTILTDSVQTITTNTAKSYTAVFELYIISPNPVPAPADLNLCGYSFRSWPATSSTGTSPNSIKFVYMTDNDPPVNSSVAGFTSGAYNLSSRSRINGLGDLGFSFINTSSAEGNVGYPGMKLGGAILALNTTENSNVSVSWIGRTIVANSRVYKIRLQYRIGNIQAFNDLLDSNGQVIEYTRGVSGSYTQMSTVNLPTVLLNQPYIQLLWRYYYTGVQNDINSGSRDELGVDEIIIKAEKTLSGNSTSGSQTESSDKIISSSNVSFSNPMLYQASQTIILTPGFRADQNTVFIAQIIGCQ
ncbi:MAG: CotH kinase family protein [Emticicia sp.]